MSAPRPHLTVAAGRTPEAVVLVLHGGRQHSNQPVSARQLAVLRLIPFARRITRHSGGRVAVARLRYRTRGWNAADGRLPDPVADAEWALQELAARFGQLPFAVLGHSMGARTALRVGGHRQVAAIIGLAPWLPAGEPVAQLAGGVAVNGHPRPAGRAVLLMHGTADRMTDPRATAAYADRLARTGVAVSLVEINGGRHAMLRRARLWQGLAASFVLSSLLADHQASGLPGAPNFIAQTAGLPARLTY